MLKREVNWELESRVLELPVSLYVRALCACV